MKQPNEQKLQQHLRAKARLITQVQARVIDATHLRYNRHAHCLTFEEIVATNVRPRETSNRQRGERTTSDSDSTPPLTPEAPQGSIGSQGAISPLIRQQMCSKAAQRSVLLKRESQWRYLKPNNSKGITVEFIAESCCVYALFASEDAYSACRT